MRTKIGLLGSLVLLLLMSIPFGNVQGHMAVSPRMGEWRYIWHKQLKKRG